MSTYKNNQEGILNKLKISSLNQMQKEALSAFSSNNEIVLLSPTGTGKTLAFLLPIIELLDINCTEVQTLIIVPSRELALQIEQVLREMGTGFKVNAIYGGRPGSKDKIDLKHRPAILIGTPGRITDHLNRKSFTIDHIATLVLDEFDKSLEVGFEEEMEELINKITKVKRKILTSATQKVKIPKFVRLKNPTYINYLKDGVPQLKIKIVKSSGKKPELLVSLIKFIGNQPGIIFCNLKDSIQEVSDFLTKNKIDHGCFFGGMEQKDRERVLIKFRNGTYQLLLATDLAARGLDIQELKFIIHYELPNRGHEFTHRNGRTARMNNDGTAYILSTENEELPEFIKKAELLKIDKGTTSIASVWKTLYVTGGRNDKISKGDIAGLFFKIGKLKKEQLGVIEVKQDCSYVAVHTEAVNDLINKVNNNRLKKKKVRVSIL